MRLAFGAFTLDLDRRELTHQDRVQPLEPKAFLVLAYLVEYRDRAISKEELLKTCWPGEFVTESVRGRWGATASHQNAAGLRLPLRRCGGGRVYLPCPHTGCHGPRAD
jgi:hypothetical protein